MQEILNSLIVNPEWHTSCSQLINAQGWLLSIFTCTSAFLFFLRVRAVFFAGRKATACFLFLWLIVLGSCVQVPRTTRASLSTTSVSAELDALHGNFTSQGDAPQFCEVIEMDVACLSCNISTLIFDTIVFLSLAWRILYFHAEEDTWHVRFKYFIGKLRLPYISETVLRGSQKYYMWVYRLSHITLSSYHKVTDLFAVFHCACKPLPLA